MIKKIYKHYFLDKLKYTILGFSEDKNKMFYLKYGYYINPKSSVIN